MAALARASTLPSRRSPAEDSESDSDGEQHGRSDSEHGSDSGAENEDDGNSGGKTAPGETDNVEVCWKAIDALVKLE